MNKFKQLVLGALLLVGTTAVLALPISGSMDMSGSFYALDADGAQTSDAKNAISIDFYFFDMDNKFRIKTADGDFSGLETITGVTSTLGDIKDLQFASFSAPVIDFWIVGGFSFELTDVFRSNDSSTFIDLTGTGIITADGYDATDATWEFSGDSAGGLVFSWSASSYNVPEPGMLALLSIGLIGFGLRKKFI